MKIYNKLLLFLLLIGCSCGCGNFFEENSQNQAYVASLTDLDELLVGEAYINAEGFTPFPTTYEITRLMAQTRFYFPWIHLLDDDITHFAEGYNAGANSWMAPRSMAAYGWQRNPFLDENANEYAPDEWKNTYKRIAVLNSILYELDKLGEESEDVEMGNRIEGEASFLRAYYYYWLVNLYAQPYAVATAETELGVPLKISEAVEDKYFSRASVHAVYEQIREDLKRSMTAFKDVEAPERPVLANYTSACILMSRVCLYMEDYDGAIAYADSAIVRGGYSILDLNSLSEGDSFTKEDSPETVFTQGGYIVGLVHSEDSLSARLPYALANAYATSQDLLNCYSENDLRRKIFFTNPHFTKSMWRCLKFRELSGRIGDYMLFRFPEVYLNKAEALAIKGNEAEAKNVLNILREKRFVYGMMPTIEEEMTASGENLVNFIRTERRREFCFEGQRWFDLRRYAVNSQYPYSKAIRHAVKEWQGPTDASGSYVEVGYYELKPYTEDRAAYVFPLPSEEIIFNKGELVQNEIRPEREIIRY